MCAHTSMLMSPFMGMFNSGMPFLKVPYWFQVPLDACGTRPTGRAASMDLRTYGIGAQILKDLGVGKMQLLASPRKMPSMTGFDLEVTGYRAAPDA